MNKGQSTLEYAFIIVCLVAAFLAMQIYFKRAVQGKMKQAADDFGQQYSPKHTTSDITTTQESDIETTTTTEEVDGKLKTTTFIDTKEQKDKTYGHEDVGKFEPSLFE